MKEVANEIIVYQPDETVRLDVRLQDDTVWLNRRQLAQLFGRDIKTIGKHIANELREELAGMQNANNPTVANFATVQDESGRQVIRQVEYYNLDMILSVGYRVKSPQGILFRRWATKVLKEYLLKGYAVNDRFERLERRVAKTEERINYFVRTSLPPMEGVLFEGQICDGHEVAMKIIKSARKSIVLIDNWVDGSVFTMLGARKRGVSARVYSKKFGAETRLALEKHNAQYAPIEYVQYSGAHDWFLILDGETVYHLGASLKDLGTKLFAFSKLSIPASDILSALRTRKGC